MKPQPVRFRNEAAGKKYAADYERQFRGVDDEPPEALNRIADVVLNYRPKDKRKKARKRKRPKKAKKNG